jgi:DNA recombination protein RmuC
LDSKLPLEDYIRLCDAVDNTDVAGIERERKNLEQRVLDEARSVRKYISVPKTTPYAIMYLATEGLYAEIMKMGIKAEVPAPHECDEK